VYQTDFHLGFGVWEVCVSRELGEGGNKIWGRPREGMELSRKQDYTCPFQAGGITPAIYTPVSVIVFPTRHQTRLPPYPYGSGLVFVSSPSSAFTPRRKLLRKMALGIKFKARNFSLKKKEKLQITT
jgi:hypothetical protein